MAGLVFLIETGAPGVSFLPDRIADLGRGRQTEHPARKRVLIPRDHLTAAALSGP